MRGLIVVALLALAAPALASEGKAPPPEGAAAWPAKAPETTEAAAEPVPAAAEAKEPDARDAAPEPAGRRPQFRWVDFAVPLAQARHPARQANLFAPIPPPLVVADGFGLRVQRRFGR